MNVKPSHRTGAKRRIWCCAAIAVVAMGLAAAMAHGAEDDTAAAPVAGLDLQHVDLRPRLAAGQQTRYRVWTRKDTTNTMSAGGETHDFTVSYTVEGEVDWRIERVKSDGSATATMTLAWISVVYEMPDGSRLTADTRKGRGEPEGLYQTLAAMVGPVSVEVAADGSITGVKGVDALRRKAGPEASFPQDLDFIESASDLATIPFAPADLAVGRAWEASFRWTHELGHLNYAVKNTLTAVEEIAGIPIANVRITGPVKLEVDRSKMPKDGPPIDVKTTEGTFEAQVMFDLRRGEAVGRNSVSSRTIDITIRLPQQTMTRRTRERVQSQALRVVEE
jgi:hypothetical protein